MEIIVEHHGKREKWKGSEHGGILTVHCFGSFALDVQLQFDIKLKN